MQTLTWVTTALTLLYFVVTALGMALPEGPWKRFCQRYGAALGGITGRTAFDPQKIAGEAQQTNKEPVVLTVTLDENKDPKKPV